MSRSLGRGLGALGLALFVAAAAGAEMRRVEAVGAIGLAADGGRSTPPRDAAVSRALTDAVRRVALELLDERGGEEPPELLAGALGDDPFAYASRFRILEDRGERSALLIEEPGVTREYVVMVEAYVDADRVRERLAAAGLLEPPSGDTARGRMEVVVLGLDGYDDYRAVREALLEAGARSVTPLEIEPGRAVFEVNGGRGSRRMLDSLQRFAGADGSLELVEEHDDALVLRLGRGAPPAEPADPGSSGFDTPGRNRY